jgi:diacylglycerol kinase (ATP)
VTAPIAIIVNPIAGKKKGGKLEVLLRKQLPFLSYDLFWSKSTAHLHTLAQEVASQPYQLIVAAGGDGTVNIVASYLVNTDKIFFILPLGSGNGFARMLGIPLTLKDAIQYLTFPITYTQHDTYKLNDKFFLNVAGMGFDALISNRFLGLKKRGFWGYFKTVIKAFPYPCGTFELKIDNDVFEGQAFLIAIANGNQWGNNMYIAPGASATDQKLNITVLKPFPFYQVIFIALRLRWGLIHKSKYVHMYETEAIHFRIIEGEKVVHTDGEPFYIYEKAVIRHAGFLRIFTR